MHGAGTDVYKRFDFIDAVLEEGAMPTVPFWCDVGVTGSRPSVAARSSSAGAGDRHGSVAEEDASDAESDSDADGARDSPKTTPTRSPMPVAGSDAPPGWLGSWRRSQRFTATCVDVIRAGVSAALSGAPPSKAKVVVASPVILCPEDLWRTQRGQCTGVLKLVVQACLSRYACASTVLCGGTAYACHAVVVSPCAWSLQ